MNIKFTEHSRIATYGVALGFLIYAVWRGLARIFVPRHFDPRRLRGGRGSR